MWVPAMQKKNESTRSIRNNHALLFSTMEQVVLLKYGADIPCRGLDQPSGENFEDDARFLTHAEFEQTLAVIPTRYTVIPGS